MTRPFKYMDENGNIQTVYFDPNYTPEIEQISDTDVCKVRFTAPDSSTTVTIIGGRPSRG